MQRPTPFVIPAAAPHRSSGQPLLVATLAVTQTVGYGVLYYAFAVVLHPIATDLDVSPATVTGALTLAVLISAVAAVPVGHWLDRRGGRGLMTVGSTLGALATLAWSRADTVAQLYLAFALIGVASAMVLYEAAFAVLVSVLDPVRRRTAVLAVTMVAGFASSIFIPLAGALNAHYGWRTTIAILAVAQAATIPLHAFALRRTGPAGAATRSPRTGLRPVLHDRAFWLLASAFTLHAAGQTMLAVHLVAYLTHRGHSPVAAAGITGLLGVLSVTGRLLTAGLTRHYSMTAVVAAVFVLQATAALALAAAGRSTLGATVCVVAFGLGFGVSTIARPAILADRYDTRQYATIAGAVATPAIVAKAAAPMAAALLIAGAGYTPALAAVAALCLLSAVCLAVSGRSPSHARGLVKP